MIYNESHIEGMYNGKIAKKCQQTRWTGKKY